MNTKEQYYLIPKRSPIGEKLEKLVRQCNEAEAEADKLAKELGAIAYSPDIFNDFGGITAFEFPNNKVPDERLYAFYQNENGVNWYGPNVDVTVKPMPVSTAELLKDKYGYIVDDKEKNFQEVAMAFSREEIMQMSGMKFSGQSLSKFLKDKLITKEEMMRLECGEVPEEVLLNTSPALLEQVNVSINEYKMLKEALSPLRFRMVAHVRGSRKAIQLYKRMQALPVVPGGLANAIVGASNKEYRVGIVYYGDNFYISCHEELHAAGMQPVSKEEFDSIARSTANPERTQA